MVEYQQIGGGAAEVTSFSDSFNRASADIAPSKDWLPNLWGYGGAAGNARWTEFRIGTTAGAQGLIINGAGVSNPSVGTESRIFPTALIQTCWGKNQFAQVDIVEEVTFNSDGHAGLHVLAGGSDVTGVPSYYVLDMTNGTYRVVRVSAGVGTVLLNPVARAALPLTIKLAAVINAADVTLTVSINGAVVQNIVDNAGSRVTVGTVAMYGDETITGGNTTKHGFRNFVAGRL